MYFTVFYPVLHREASDELANPRYLLLMKKITKIALFEIPIIVCFAYIDIVSISINRKLELGLQSKAIDRCFYCRLS